MAGPEGRQPPLPNSVVLASALTGVLAALASAAGLFVPGLYRDPAVLLPQVYGQDALTLVVAVPVLVCALVYTRRGSLRAYVVWLGVTAYLLYTYLTYAVMTAFNELYLVYTTLVFLSLYSFVAGLVRLDARVLRDRVAHLDVRPYVAFEALLALLVGGLWLAEVVPATLAGTVPPSAADAGLPVNPIQSLDLGVVLPAFLLTAYWLRAGRPWGYAFTAVLLAKGATLGLAILAMVATMLRAGHPVPVPQVVIFGLVTVAALALLARFLAAMGPETTADVTGHPAAGDD